MSDVLLLHAEDTHTRGFVGAMPPLGLAWLAGTLETAGISVEILDRQVEDRGFEEVFAAAAPAVLGISTTTATRFEAFRRLIPHKEDIGKVIAAVRVGEPLQFTLRKAPLVVKETPDATLG